MKTNKYVAISVVGILSVLFLQAMWIRQTVLYTETNMVEDIDKVVVKSMFSEVYKDLYTFLLGLRYLGLQILLLLNSMV